MSNNNLQHFFNQIEKLQLEEPDDDDYIYLPTEYAVERTKSFLAKLDEWMGITFPGNICLESRGGLDIVWRNNDVGIVWLVIAANANIDNHVYWRDYRSDESFLLKNPTISKVAELLDLLFWRENDVTLMDYEPKLIGGGDPHGMNHFEREELLKTKTYSKENK